MYSPPSFEHWLLRYYNVRNQLDELNGQMDGSKLLLVSYDAPKKIYLQSGKTHNSNTNKT